MSDSPSKTAEITIFKKSDGILSKTIRAATDGSPVSDGSACRMSSGAAKRMPLPDGAQKLADLIEKMTSSERRRIGSGYHRAALEIGVRGQHRAVARFS